MSDETFVTVAHLARIKEYGTERLSLTFVRRSDTGAITNHPSTQDYDDRGLYLSGLTASVYVDRSKEPVSVYGYSLQYEDSTFTDLSKAKAMVKCLTSIDKKLDKFNEEWGYATDFTQYAMRICKALGVTEFITTKSNGYAMWSEQSIRTHKVADMAWQVRNILECDKAIA